AICSHGRLALTTCSLTAALPSSSSYGVYIIAIYVLSCHGGNRDVLSFPTRRSSDLEVPACNVPSRSPLPALAIAPETKLGKECRSESGSAGMPRPISYAVFCLKKKTIKWLDEIRHRLHVLTVNKRPLGYRASAIPPE